MNPNALPAGIHPYTVTDDNGCTYNDDVTINEPDILSSLFTISVNDMCVTNILNSSGQYILSNNSTGPILNYTWEITEPTTSFLWTSSTTSNTIPTLPTLPQGVGPLEYSIKLTANTISCGSDDNIQTITINPEPQINFDIWNGSVSACNTNQVAGVEIEININSYIVPWSATPVPFGNPDGNTEYIVISTPGAEWPPGIPNPTQTIYPYFNGVIFTWPEIKRVYPISSTTPYPICITV